MERDDRTNWTAISNGFHNLQISTTYEEAHVLDGVTGDFVKAFVSLTNNAWNWLQVDFARVETAVRKIEVYKRKERETRFSVKTRQ